MEIPLDQLEALLPEELWNKVKSSIEVIEKALDQFQLSELAICFNGGKDCTVLLHLLHLILKKRLDIERIKPPGVDHQNWKPCSLILTVYFVSQHSFPEVSQFMEDSVQRYGLNLLTMTKPMKEGLQEIISEKGIKAMFTGARSTDPHCGHLHAFEQTDPGWPQMIRVNPLLDWSYADIWNFLLILKVPYCSLYDQGYTSIGTTKDTRPNPYLKTSSGSYNPAHQLTDGSKERDGR